MVQQNTRNQYLLEAQQRYFKFLQAEDSQETKVRERALEEKTLAKEKKKQKKDLEKVATLAFQEAPEKPSLTMDRYLTSRFRAVQVILDSSFRHSSMQPNDFSVKLTEPLRNVVALRLMKTEYFQPSQCTNYFVFNNIRVPIQAFTMESAYLYLNGYSMTNVATISSLSGEDTANTPQFFGRIGPGMEVYPAINGNITQDPYIYLLQPMEQRLRRFHVRLLQANGSPYATESTARVVITLTAYCLLY